MRKLLKYVCVVVRLDDGAIDLVYSAPGDSIELKLRLTPNTLTPGQNIARFQAQVDLLDVWRASRFATIIEAAAQDALNDIDKVAVCAECRSLYGEENALPSVFGIPGALSGATRFLCSEHAADRVGVPHE